MLSGLLIALLGLPCLAPDPQATCPMVTARQRRGSVKIYERPSRGGHSIGEIRHNGGATVIAEDRKGGGCSRWLRAYPLGFLCLDEVTLHPEPLPLPPPPPPPRYAVVRSAQAGPLHRGDGVTLVGELDDQRPLLRTASHYLLRRTDLDVVTPTPLQGRDLRAVPEAQRYTLAFLIPEPGQTTVTLQPAGLAVPRYTAVWVSDAKAAPGRVAVRVDGEGDTRGEVDEARLRRVLPPEPPEDLQPQEHWIDVSLAQQVAVAYEGRSAVFATLVSTAKRGNPTGVFVIHRKYRTQTMQNRPDHADQPGRYDYRDVPAAQFYNGRYGLHAALWHDRLGEPVSHGCVNLSPADAERLLAFTDPPLPAGWQTIRAAPPLPQSRIVIHR